LDVVEADDKRSLLLEQLPKGPRDLVGAGGRVALSRSNDRTAFAACASLGKASSCFTTSTTGQ